MLRSCNLRLATGVCKNPKRRLWGTPGMPIIRAKYNKRLALKNRSVDLVVEHNSTRKQSYSLLHYLGKHCPHPQKSLWSPDTPVMQDRHLFMLTTLDIDAFKYWFGVKRARFDEKSWSIIAKSGLMPPTYLQNNPLTPKPVFDKESLYKYFLANNTKKSIEQVEREKYLHYENGMPKTDAERAAERPQAPWM